MFRKDKLDQWPWVCHKVQSIQSYAILEEHTEFGCLKRPLTGKKKFSHFNGPIDIGYTTASIS